MFHGDIVHTICALLSYARSSLLYDILSRLEATRGGRDASCFRVSVYMTMRLDATYLMSNSLLSCAGILFRELYDSSMHVLTAELSPNQLPNSIYILDSPIPMDG